MKKKIYYSALSVVLITTIYLIVLKKTDNPDNEKSHYFTTSIFYFFGVWIAILFGLFMLFLRLFVNKKIVNSFLYNFISFLNLITGLTGIFLFLLGTITEKIIIVYILSAFFMGILMSYILWSSSIKKPIC